MNQLKPGKGAGIWWSFSFYSFLFILNTMILGLYYKPLRTRNLQKFDIFHSKLVSSIISHKHASLYKHTSLLWNPYNMKPSCFFIVKALGLNQTAARKGPGKSTQPFSAKHMRISAPRQASVGRATWQGSEERKSTDVVRKTVTLIFPYPARNNNFTIKCNNPSDWHFSKSIFLTGAIF
jgi:hypothetical protein